MSANDTGERPATPDSVRFSPAGISGRKKNNRTARRKSQQSPCSLQQCVSTYGFTKKFNFKKHNAFKDLCHKPATTLTHTAAF